MDTVTVFVALLDEGTEVWRPAQAERIDAAHFRLLGPVPDDEVWAFSPGTIVRAVEKTFSGGTTALVAIASEVE